MILQALVEHYEDLVSLGKLDRPGWSNTNISYALYINDDGELEQVVSLKREVERGKKKALVARPLPLPAPVKRSSGIEPNFLWDNSSYILGIDEKGKPERSRECFNTCRKLHHKILDGVDSAAARALIAFFDKWDPQKTEEHPALVDKLEDVISGVNITFRYNATFVHEDAAIRAAWQECYDADADGPEMTCLVTGKKCAAERVHPAIKGVAGAQSSGAALVSFNSEAFCSFGREQNLNAPTSKYAAFAYTSALNHLLADREHVGRIGDTTVLLWAKGGQSAYQSCAMASLFGNLPENYTTADLQKMMLDLLEGKPVEFEEELIAPETLFYVLGLAPNAARLSVRFFLKNSFGQFMESIHEHYKRLEIIRPEYDKFETIPLWRLLDETVNQNSRDKSPAPGLSGETLRAILNNTPYPATLLNGVTSRIRAERNVTKGRAAIIKAYYLKNPHSDIPKEVLTVSLNPDSTNIPYNLGRLFSVLEDIQTVANPRINATIKDKYFNSASATPSRVFPVLVNLAQKHLKKLPKDRAIYLNKQLSKIEEKLGEAYPDRLNLPQQGSFQLGYYHQTQARYTK